MSKKFQKLSELAGKLPQSLKSDWDGTNHFELTAPYESEDYFWLMVGDGLGSGDDCHTVCGQRLGLIMDIAAEVARLRDAGEL